MAKDKKNNGGGSNGDGGAPAEAHVEPTQQADATPAEAPPDQQAAAAGDAPAETSVDSVVDRLKAMGLDELKAAQEAAHKVVEEQEKRLAESIAAERTIEHTRCLRYQEKAKEQGKKKAIFMLDGKRTTIKKRSNSEVLMFVSAEVQDAIEIY